MIWPLKGEYSIHCIKLQKCDNFNSAGDRHTTEKEEEEEKASQKKTEKPALTEQWTNKEGEEL